MPHANLPEGAYLIEKPSLQSGIYIFLRVIHLIYPTNGVKRGGEPRKSRTQIPLQGRIPWVRLVGSLQLLTIPGPSHGGPTED